MNTVVCIIVFSQRNIRKIFFHLIHGSDLNDEMAQPILLRYKLLYSTPTLFTNKQSKIHRKSISLVGFLFFGSQIQTIVEYIGEKRGKSGDESMRKT